MEFALQLYFSQCSFTTSARHITPVLFSNSMSAAPGGSCWSKLPCDRKLRWFSPILKRMRSVTGTGRFVKAMVSSRQGWHRCIRRQCQDLSVNCHILDSNFWNLHFVDYTFNLMASGYATMPLCLQGSWTEELQCVHSLPAMFGHHQVCGMLSMVKVIFFRDCALAFLLSKRLQET